jgi:hypothetical protein
MKIFEGRKLKILGKIWCSTGGFIEKVKRIKNTPLPPPLVNFKVFGVRGFEGRIGGL